MIALLAAGLLLQCDRDTDPVKLPGDADAPYRLGRLDEAERDLRAQLARGAGDKIRAGLLQVLWRARRYEEGLKEASAAAAAAKDDAAKASAKAMAGAFHWRLGDAAAAKTACDEAIALADAKAPNAYPAARAQARQVLGFLPWRRASSERVDVWTPPGSKADAAGAGRRLDAAFDRIAEAIGATLKERVDVFLYDDQRQADDILGAPLGFAAPRDKAIHLLADAHGGHEMAHLLSFYAGAERRERPKSPLLLEGIACAFSGEPLWEGRLKEVPAALARRGKLPSLAELAGAGVDALACSGAFVRMLHETHGKEKFARLWREFNDHADPWREVYGKTLDELDRDFRAHVERGSK